MKVDKLREMYVKYNLTRDDVYKHKHYTIITRTGIDKIQAIENINITYNAVKCESDFAVVQAYAEKYEGPGAKEGTHSYRRIETFGSAKYGGKVQNSAGKWVDEGSTTSWYIIEMAEKRAMSRAVLKLTGMYELGVFGQDEAEEFKSKTGEAINAKELINN